MIAENIAEVRARIAAAAQRASRDPAEITLIAVTKEVEAQAARAAAAGGVADLGENRVQELRRKQDVLADLNVRWHMIGTLQRNKVSHVVGRVHMIHSVDTASLASSIGRRATAAGLTQDVLLEVNAGGEVSKHGLRPSETAAVARGLLDVPGIRVRGLMTIAPQGDPDAARHAFRTLRALRDSLRADAPDVRELSMGMTEDFELAVEEGATIVRIGTAIFGSRTAARGSGDTEREK